MNKPLQFVLIVWRIWRAHTPITFCRIGWYYLKAKFTGEWETWLWDCVPLSGRVAIDVGANIGQWTNKLASRFHEVIAIEPHPASVKLLRAKASFNVRVVEGAAWNCSEWKMLILYPDLRICRITDHDLLYSMGKGANGLEVPCFPIDALRQTQVDLIKLDVEGAEVEALEGAIRTIKASSPILLIELHSARARQQVESLLSSLGYTWEYKHYPFYRQGDKREAELDTIRLWMLAKKGDTNALSSLG